MVTCDVCAKFQVLGSDPSSVIVGQRKVPVKKQKQMRPTYCGVTSSTKYRLLEKYIVELQAKFQICSLDPSSVIVVHRSVSVM